MKRNRPVQKKKVIKRIGIILLSAVAVLLGIPAWIYLCLGEDVYLIEMEKKIGGENFKDLEFGEYMVNGITVRPGIEQYDYVKYTIEIAAFSDEPRELIVSEVMVSDQKTKDVIFKGEKRLHMNTEKLEGTDHCFDIEFYEDVEIDEKYMQDNRKFTLQFTANAGDEKYRETKVMKYVFNGYETRILDTP